MKIEQVLFARRDWYDRSPTLVRQEFTSLGVVPHGATSRWTYTPTAGNKCWVAAMQVFMRRNVAATTADRIEARIGTVIGGVTRRILYETFNSNTVDTLRDAVLGMAFIIDDTVTLEAVTADGSTGGSVDYAVNFHGIEFTG